MCYVVLCVCVCVVRMLFVKKKIKEYGVVNRVVSGNPSNVVTEAQNFVRQIAKTSSPFSMMTMKRQVYYYCFVLLLLKTHIPVVTWVYTLEPI